MFSLISETNLHTPFQNKICDLGNGVNNEQYAVFCIKNRHAMNLGYFSCKM